jgi:hypothetical protein
LWLDVQQQQLVRHLNHLLYLKMLQVSNLAGCLGGDVFLAGTCFAFCLAEQRTFGTRQLAVRQLSFLNLWLADSWCCCCCLQAHLPDCLELVQVTGGYAVLSCKGLYEVQLSLFQQPYPPQLAEAREAAAAAAAAQQADGQQGEQQVHDAAGTSAAAVKQQEDAAAGPTSSPSEPEVQVRWQWTLTHAVLLPNAATKPPLRQVQLEQLLRALRERMWYAADSAAIEAARRAAGEPADSAAAAVSGKTSSQQQSAGGSSGQRGSAQPAASGVTGGSTASGISSASAAAGKDAAKDAGRGLQLDQYAADEISIPLRVMHGVLRDVAAQVLLHEVRAAAEKLAGLGSDWEGQLKLSRAEVLTPGIRMHYWQKVPVLLAQQPTGAAGTAAAADAATLPAVEVGLGSDGTVQVMHLPPLRSPGSLQQVPLVLDSHTVDIEGLLLQAVAVTASTQLQMLRRAVMQLLRPRGLEPFAQLQLCSFGQVPKATPQPAAAATSAAAAAAAVRVGDTGEPSAAAAAAAIAAAVAGVIGSGSSSSTAADGSSSAAAAAGVRMPEQLLMVLDGNVLVSVSLQPWSGRVLLRPGSAYGGELNMEMDILLTHVSMIRLLDIAALGW